MIGRTILKFDVRLITHYLWYVPTQVMSGLLLRTLFLYLMNGPIYCF